MRDDGERGDDLTDDDVTRANAHDGRPAPRGIGARPTRPQRPAETSLQPLHGEDPARLARVLSLATAGPLDAPHVYLRYQLLTGPNNLTSLAAMLAIKFRLPRGAEVPSDEDRALIFTARAGIIGRLRADYPHHHRRSTAALVATYWWRVGKLLNQVVDHFAMCIWRDEIAAPDDPMAARMARVIPFLCDLPSYQGGHHTGDSYLVRCHLLSDNLIALLERARVAAGSDLKAWRRGVKQVMEAFGFAERPGDLKVLPAEPTRWIAAELVCRRMAENGRPVTVENFVSRLADRAQTLLEDAPSGQSASLAIAASPATSPEPLR